MRFTKGGLLLSLFFVVLVAVLAAGCGSDETTSGTQAAAGSATISEAAKNLDPCSLLTKSEVEEVLGQPVNDPDRKGTSCTYNTTDTAQFASISVVAQPGVMSDYEFLKNENQTDKAQAISGLGDAAMYTTETQLLVLKKDVVITINSFGKVTQDNLKALAEDAVARVP
jgi:hypothetical protein